MEVFDDNDELRTCTPATNCTESRIYDDVDERVSRSRAVRSKYQLDTQGLFYIQMRLESPGSDSA